MVTVRTDSWATPIRRSAPNMQVLDSIGGILGFNLFAVSGDPISLKKGHRLIQARDRIDDVIEADCLNTVVWWNLQSVHDALSPDADLVTKLRIVLLIMIFGEGDKRLHRKSVALAF